MHYHIILTEKCNSRCKYCYEKSMQEFENGLEKKWSFDDSPVDSEVDVNKLKKFMEQDSDPTIIFYGGEPLLQIDKIKSIMDNIDAKFCMQTNGKLLDKIPKEYMNRMSKILVSTDGSRERTDANRGGSFDLVLKNIKLIRENGFTGEVVARMTIIYPDIFEQIKNILDFGVFDSVHWQLDAGFYKNDFDKEKFIKFVEEYNQQISDLIKFWVDEMKKGKVIKLYPLLGIFESIYHGTKTKLRCGSGYANYTITTKGDLSACPIMNSVKDFYCGNLDSELKDVKEIHCGEPCTSCDYYGLCGGRCLYSNYAKLWPEDGEKLICKTIIHLIEELKKALPEIKELIARGTISEKDFEYEKYFGPEIIP